MSIQRLDNTILALDALKPVVKLVPIAGQYLENIADLLRLACTHAKDVKLNKEDITALTERAIYYVTIINENAQKMPETEINDWMSAIYYLQHLMEELVAKTKRQAERRFLSRVMRKDMDKEDIANLSKRLDQVIVQLGMLLQLKMHAVEDMLDRVKQLGIEQERLQIEREKVKEAHIKAEQNALLDKLHSVASARHDHEDAPRGCTEGTRVPIIKNIVEWVTYSTTLHKVFWLSGFAGSGKTTIMKTLSVRLDQLGVLGGCFFISIKSEDRCNPQNIIHTLVYQLAQLQPVLCEPICDVLRNNPDVINQTMTSQITTLLLDPFVHVLDKIKKPIVILIDAMDVCDKTDSTESRSFSSTLLSAIDQHPAKLKLVLTSRLTPNIQRAFKAVTAQHLRLHEIEIEPVDADIVLHLKTEFEKITLHRGLEHSPPWYTSENLDELAKRAGGSFVYVFTVTKWVNNMRFMPNDCLHKILERRHHKSFRLPFQAVDDLYGFVLQNALGLDNNKHHELSRLIQRILEVLVVAFRPLSIPELAEIVELDEETVRLNLEQLFAVVSIPERDSIGSVAIYHTLFVEYLTDAERCLPKLGFFVSVWDAHGRTGTRCLHLDYDHRYGKDGYINMENAGNSRFSFAYASDNWRSHLELSSNSASFLVPAVNKVRELTSQRREDMEALSDLSCLLFIQCMRTDEHSVILEKIDVDRQLVDLARSVDSPQDTSILRLAQGLWTLYLRNADEQLLQEAIGLDRELLELHANGHPSRDLSLTNLADGFRSLYEHNGNEQLLYDAIELDREALKLRPPGHCSRDETLSNLAVGLQSLYQSNGDEQCLYEAIKMDREALELRPLGHPFRDWSLNSLAAGLRSLYKVNEDEQFLQEAIRLESEE